MGIIITGPVSIASSSCRARAYVPAEPISERRRPREHLRQ
jgi:hypothetical protein